MLEGLKPCLGAYCPCFDAGNASAYWSLYFRKFESSICRLRCLLLLLFCCCLLLVACCCLFCGLLLAVCCLFCGALSCVSLVLRQSAVPFLRDRFWVAVTPMALAKSRSERSAFCLAAPLLVFAQRPQAELVWCCGSRQSRSSGTAFGSLSLP